MSAPANSFFRVAGLTYNQYAAIASRAAIKVLKPEAAAKRKVDLGMRERAFAKDGKGGEKSKLNGALFEYYVAVLDLVGGFGRWIW